MNKLTQSAFLNFTLKKSLLKGELNAKTNLFLFESIGTAV